MHIEKSLSCFPDDSIEITRGGEVVAAIGVHRATIKRWAQNIIEGINVFDVYDGVSTKEGGS